MYNKSKLIMLCMLLVLTLIPFATVQAASVSATVDWTQDENTVTGDHFGVNSYQGTDPNETNATEYIEGINYMNPGFLRIHNAHMLKDVSLTRLGWIDENAKVWDTNKINNAMAGIDQLNVDRILMSIPKFPSWMDTDADGFLDTDQFDNYAALSADLVSIVNNGTRYVEYWEPTNERDKMYADAGRFDELITIWQKCYTAIKAVDPNLKVGGLAFMRPDLYTNTHAFIDATKDQVDFISLHTYASGSTTDSNAYVYDKSVETAAHVEDAVNYIASVTTRGIPIYLDEFNISWNPPDDRMNNHIGAVFDALNYVEVINVGGGGIFPWNEKDGWYGKMSSTYEMRPGGHLLNLLNENFKGTSVAVSDNSTDIRTFAVKNTTTNQKSYMIINRSDNQHDVATSFSGWDYTPSDTASFEMDQISQQGLTSEYVQYNTLKGGLTVPPNSVTMVSIVDEAPDTEAPTVPSNLSSLGSTDTTVGLEWDASADNVGVHEYDVYQDASLVGSTDKTYHIVEGLTETTSYTFTVKARDKAGNISDASNAVTETTQAAGCCENIMAPTDDTYVRDGAYADSNYGSSTSIDLKKGVIDYTRQGYFKFDLSSLSGTISSAVVRLYGGHNGSEIDAPIEAYAVSDTSWSENTITWNTKPASGELLTKAFMPDGTAQWHEWDLTEYVQEEQKAGRDVISIHLVAQNATNLNINMNSKEATSNQAQIVVENLYQSVSDLEAPTVPANLTATGTSSSQIDLNWTASTDNVGVEGYKVYRDGTEVGDTTVTSYSDTGLASATTYSYTVKAYDAAGNLSADSNSASATTADNSNIMLVQDITMTLLSGQGNTWASATILITDENGNPVANATVSGDWSGNTFDSDTGITGGDGKVIVESNTVANPGKGTYTFTVTGVTHGSMTYDSSQNVMTSNSITK